MLRANIIVVDENIFTFIHKWTRDIEPNRLVFSQEFNPSPYYRRRITKVEDNIGRFIATFYAKEKVFYADNEVGELVRNYLQWCQTDRGIR